jgi:hypothetical protein
MDYSHITVYSRLERKCFRARPQISASFPYYDYPNPLFLHAERHPASHTLNKSSAVIFGDALAGVGVLPSSLEPANYRTTIHFSIRIPD